MRSGARSHVSKDPSTRQSPMCARTNRSASTMRIAAEGVSPQDGARQQGATEWGLMNQGQCTFGIRK
jgi:hypothetical protein